MTDVCDLNHMTQGILHEMKLLVELRASLQTPSAYDATLANQVLGTLQKKFALLEAIDGKRLDILDGTSGDDSD